MYSNLKVRLCHGHVAVNSIVDVRRDNNLTSDVMSSQHWAYCQKFSPMSRFSMQPLETRCRYHLLAGLHTRRKYCTGTCPLSSVPKSFGLMFQTILNWNCAFSSFSLYSLIWRITGFQWCVGWLGNLHCSNVGLHAPKPFCIWFFYFLNWLFLIYGAQAFIINKKNI